MLFYCFISAKLGEVYKSTVQRRSARQFDREDSDKIFEARILAVCYKMSSSYSINQVQFFYTNNILYLLLKLWIKSQYLS